MDSQAGPLCLKDFLEEAELQQYYESFRDILKINKISQLKFVNSVDLTEVGLSKPEQRRYKKIYTKYFGRHYFTKIKKLLSSSRKNETATETNNTPSSTTLLDEASNKISTKHIIPVDDITINKELGTGEFGVVQQGTWTNNNQRIQVAIKCLGRERMNSNSFEFLKEAAVMHSIEHPNIVRLYGVVLHLDSLMLVTELAPLRSLLECLKEFNLRESFPVLTLCNFAEQICDGMTYLESKRLIHRDLAARNILVFSKNRVKISDFGLSRALGVGKDYYQTNYNVNLKLPLAWCAPECILFLRFTSASDVWAYAVTLWEMFSYGFQPWAAFSGQQILAAIDEPNCQRLEKPECCPESYYAIIVECWAHDPAARPKFKDLHVRLRNARPEQVIATVKSAQIEGRRSNFLSYKAGDKITVIGKERLANSNLLTGVLNNGACGLFNPENTQPYIPPDLPRQVVNPYKPSEDLEEVPLLNPNSPSHLTGGASSVPPFHMLTGGAAPSHIEGISLERREPVHVEEARTSVRENTSKCPSKWHNFKHPTASKSFMSKVKSATLGKSFRHDDKSNSANKNGEGPHEYQEIDNETSAEVPAAESFVPPRSQTDFGQSLIDEIECMFKNINVPPTNTAKKGGTVNQRCHTLSHFCKKKGHSEIVKPMSAHEQKTLETAVAMANELTSKSMNDLDFKLEKAPTSPTEKKFHFKFPSISHHHSHPEHVKDTQAKVERRNFSQEAQSVPDLQSTITEESRIAYASLIEQPTPSSLMTQIAHESGRRSLVPGQSSMAGHHSGTGFRTRRHEKRVGRPNSSDNSELAMGEGINVLPLPSKGSKPQLVEKARHIRIHPLVLTDAMLEQMIPKQHVPPPKPPTLPPIQPKNTHEYQNLHPVVEPPREYTKMDRKILPAKCRPEPEYMNIYSNNSVDVCDGPSVESDAQKNKATTSKSGENTKADDEGASGGDDKGRFVLCSSSSASDLRALLKDAPDHVSVEDLLEFADQKPCGRQRGTESDEVRIICKVLNYEMPEVTKEECVEALDESEWKIHVALKLFRLRNEIERLATLKECSQALTVTNGDVAQAATLLRLGKASPESAASAAD